MRQQVTKDLFSYWSRLKGQRAAPERADIDPAAIRGALADSFIIEVDAASEFPLRLCGTRLNAFWGREQKGASFLDLWRREDRHNVAAALLTVVDGVTPVIAGARTQPIGHAPLEFELLLLPLRHFGKTHSRILGALAPSYQPEWLGLSPAKPLDLLSLRILHPQPLAPPLYRPGKVSVRQASGGGPRLIVYEGGKAL